MQWSRRSWLSLLLLQTVLTSFDVEPRGLRRRVKHRSIDDWVGWALVAWTSIIVAAVISAEVAIALWWTGGPFLPGKQALAIGVPFAAIMLWTAGILVFFILVLLGAWLVETASRFTYWMRASRAP
jgi:hypothetical protein